MISTGSVIHPKVVLFHSYYFHWSDSVTQDNIEEIVGNMLEALVVDRKTTSIEPGDSVFDKNGRYLGRKPPTFTEETLPKGVRNILVSTATGHSFNQTVKALRASKAVMKVMNKHGFKKTTIDGIPNPNHSMESRVTLWYYIYPEDK